VATRPLWIAYGFLITKTKPLLEVRSNFDRIASRISDKLWPADRLDNCNSRRHSSVRYKHISFLLQKDWKTQKNKNKLTAPTIIFSFSSPFKKLRNNQYYLNKSAGLFFLNLKIT